MDAPTLARRDRLLSDANVARLRGDFAAMENACREVIALVGEQAEYLELLGDALHGQWKTAEARDCYKSAAELQPGRESAETKYARTVLEVAEDKRQRQALLGELQKPEDRETRRRRATGSTLLAIVLPGLSQLVNGQHVKAGILLGAFLLSLIIIAVLPDSRVFARQMVGYLGGPVALGGIGRGIGWLFPLVAGVAVFCYVYSLMDALTEATKDLSAGRRDRSTPGPRPHSARNDGS